MTHVIRRLWVEEEGQGITEYGLILVLIAVVVIGALSGMGDRLRVIFNDILTGLGGTPV